MRMKTNRPAGIDDLVVVRASDLQQLRNALAVLESSADDTGCSDGLTVADGKHLEQALVCLRALTTKPLTESLRMVHPASEHLDRLMVVLPPEVSIEHARSWVLRASELVTEGLGDADDPDQDAFIREVEAMGLHVETHIGDLGVGAWDAPTPGAPAQVETGVDVADTVYAVVQEGGSSGELYLTAWPTEAEANDFRFSCRDEGSYRTSAPLPLPRALAKQKGFPEAVEQFMRLAALDLAYPEGDAPDDHPSTKKQGQSRERIN